jgi:hypothetical protein
MRAQFYKPQFSPFLYKFMSPRSKGLSSALLRSELWLASATDFNDPFDLRANVLFEGSGEQKATYYRDAARRFGVPPWLADEWVSDQLEAEHDTAKWQETFNALRETMGVTCFSRRRAREMGLANSGPRNILMWSHYGAMHRGLCLQFYAPADPETFIQAMPVRYSNEFISFNWLDRNDVAKALGQSLFRKAQCWQYEAESRFVIRKRAKTVASFHPDALKGIILGCAAVRTTELRAVAMCRRRYRAGGPPVRLFRAQICDAKYALRIVRAPDLEQLAECV